MRMYDKHSKFEYVTTEGRPFLVMSNYMQIGFRVEATRLFGFGERVAPFQLNEGTYTMYGSIHDNVVDDGQSKEGKEQMGAHPFLVA